MPVHFCKIVVLSEASSDVLIFSAAFWKIADKKGMADLQIFSISAGVI